MSGNKWPREQPQLAGRAISLRPFEPTDADAIYDACQDPDIQRWTTVPVPYLHEHAESFANRRNDQWLAQLEVSYCIAGLDDELLGAVGLVEVYPDGLTTEVGYWVAPAARGRRVASEAVALLIVWAKSELGFTAFELHIESGNIASLGVAQSLGATRRLPDPVPVDMRGELRSHERWVLR